MKKLSFLLLSLLAVTLFTACNDEEERVSKQTFSSSINCRAIDGDQVVFSQGSIKGEVNFTAWTITFTADYKDADNMSHTIQTPELKLTRTKGMCYAFSYPATQQGASQVDGMIDISSGMLWYVINDGSNEVVCTTSLYYAYTNTTITNPDNGNHGTHQNSAYLFGLDARGETCVMRIDNFISTLDGTIVAAELLYSGLTVTPTVEGYKITADRAESSYKGFYTITDLDITLNEQCQLIAGSFMCGDLEFTVEGSLFAMKDN